MVTSSPFASPFSSPFRILDTFIWSAERNSISCCSATTEMSPITVSIFLIIFSFDVQTNIPMQTHYPDYPYMSIIFLVLHAFMIGQLQALPVSAEQVATGTHRDQLLSKIYSYVQKGWPQTVTDGEKPYWRHAKELSTQSCCLL